MRTQRYFLCDLAVDTKHGNYSDTNSKRLAERPIALCVYLNPFLIPDSQYHWNTRGSRHADPVYRPG